MESLYLCICTGVTDGSVLGLWWVWLGAGMDGFVSGDDGWCRRVKRCQALQENSC